jgi:hypothetical protein
MEQIGYNSAIQQEFDKITKKDEATWIAQLAINTLCDFTTKFIMGNLTVLNEFMTYIDQQDG